MPRKAAHGSAGRPPPQKPRRRVFPPRRKPGIPNVIAPQMQLLMLLAKALHLGERNRSLAKPARPDSRRPHLANKQEFLRRRQRARRSVAAHRPLQVAGVAGRTTRAQLHVRNPVASTLLLGANNAGSTHRCYFEMIRRVSTTAPYAGVPTSRQWEMHLNRYIASTDRPKGGDVLHRVSEWMRGETCHMSEREREKF